MKFRWERVRSLRRNRVMARWIAWRVEISTIPTDSELISGHALSARAPNAISFEFHFFSTRKPFHSHSRDNRDKRIIYLFIYLFRSMCCLIDPRDKFVYLYIAHRYLHCFEFNISSKYLMEFEFFPIHYRIISFGKCRSVIRYDPLCSRRYGRVV